MRLSLVLLLALVASTTGEIGWPLGKRLGLHSLPFNGPWSSSNRGDLCCWDPVREDGGWV